MPHNHKVHSTETANRQMSSEKSKAKDGQRELHKTLEVANARSNPTTASRLPFSRRSSVPLILPFGRILSLSQQLQISQQKEAALLEQLRGAHSLLHSYELRAPTLNKACQTALEHPSLIMHNQSTK